MPNTIDDDVKKCLEDLGFKESSIHIRSSSGRFTDEYQYPENIDKVKLIRREGCKNTAGDLGTRLIFKKDDDEVGLTYYPIGENATRIDYNYKRKDPRRLHLNAIIKEKSPQSQNPPQRKNSSALPQLPVPEATRIVYSTLLDYQGPAKEIGQPAYPM